MNQLDIVDEDAAARRHEDNVLDVLHREVVSSPPKQRSRNRQFVQMKVWKALRRRPDVGAASIASLTRIPLPTVSDALHKMRVAGTAECVGGGTGAKWRALASKPVDMRGRAPGSQKALRLYGPGYAKMAAAVRADKLRQMRADVPLRRLHQGQSPYAGRIALEECWPTVLSTVCANSPNNVQNMHKPEANPWALSVETPEDKEAA